MTMERPSRAPFWIGLAVGFSLGIAATLGGLVAFGLWAAHMVERSGLAPAAGLPPPDTTATQASTSYDGWIEDLAGRRTRLAEFKGRVLVVHCWATWCGPCVRELPQIQALADSLGRDGVAVLAISDEAPERVRAFLARRGLHLPAYVARAELPPEFRTPAIPATFVVGRDGRIAAKQVGAADWSGESARRFIRGLL